MEDQLIKSELGLDRKKKNSATGQITITFSRPKMSKMVPACGPSTCLRPPISMKGLERHYPYPSVSPAPPSKRTRLNSIQAVVQGFIRGCDICDKELYDLSYLGQSGGQMVCRQCREGTLRSRKRKLPANKVSQHFLFTILNVLMVVF